MIRDFDLSDILTLTRLRRMGLFLDSAPMLTWGRPMVPAAAVLSPFSGALGVFTAVMEEEGEDSILAQVSHVQDSPFAHFTFLAPDDAVSSPALGDLLEYLIRKVGERGAQSLVAEVEEKSHTFSALRRANFSIYSRQRILRVNRPPANHDGRGFWRAAEEIDTFNVRKLYNLLVPGMVQQVEPAPWGDLAGWVLYENEELQAFVEVRSGPAGQWVQPFIHPEMNALDERLTALLVALGPRRNRPAYFCLRSHTSWLSLPLEDLGAEAGPPQAVMVRRLTAKVAQPERIALPDLGAQPETSSPAALYNAEHELESKPTGRG